MEKNEMIHIDPALINSENKKRYLEFYNTIFETIKESYCFLYYLNGAEQFFGKYKKTGRNFEFFVTDILRLLKQKICLNICKLIFDSKKDELTIYNMHKFIKENFHIIIKEKSFKVSNDLKNRIINIRNNFISHNLHTENSYSIDMNDLKPILDNIYSYFQKHWVENFVDDSIFVGDGYFDFIKPFYIKAIFESFNGIK